MNMGQVADSGMLTRPGGGAGSSEGEKTVGFFSFIMFFESSLYSHFHGSLPLPPPHLLVIQDAPFCPLTVCSRAS